MRRGYTKNRTRRVRPKAHGETNPRLPNRRRRIVVEGAG